MASSHPDRTARQRQRRHSPHTTLDPRSTACSLFTYPASTDTLPVYETITLTWDPACAAITSTSIDLYLNIQESAGLTAVHEWTGIVYSKGSLATTLNPGWWNASTGAGSVSAQLIITPSGNPVWDTPAPAGPTFVITYNGTYPASITASASSPTYTGPSVESVASTDNQISGSKLGAAVAVPLIAVLVAVVAYVAWNRFRKRPEQKRWSAVIDQRMSMISQGTWQPPLSSRPGSFHPSHRPSASLASAGARQSHFFADGRPSSSYSHSPYTHTRGNGSTVTTHSPLAKTHSQTDLTNDGGGARPVSSYSFGKSPLGGAAGTARSPRSGEMRQVGHGERVSRVSFAGTDHPQGRPSISSTRTAATSKTRQSWVGVPLPSPPEAARSPPLSSGFARPGPPSPSLWTEKEALAFPNHSPPLGKRASLSVNTNVRESWADYPALAVVRDGSLAFRSTSPTVDRAKSPFADPSPSPASTSSFPTVARPSRSSSRAGRPSPTLDTTDLPPPSPTTIPEMHMPMAARNSMMSPDQALRSYASQVTSPVTSPAVPSSASFGKPGLVRSASSFLTAPGRMLKGLGSRTNTPSPVPSSASQNDMYYTPREEITASPFDDPSAVVVVDEAEASASPVAVETDRFVPTPPTPSPQIPLPPTPPTPPPAISAITPKVVGRPRQSSRLQPEDLKNTTFADKKKSLRVSATPTVESRYSQASTKMDEEEMWSAM